MCGHDVGDIISSFLPKTKLESGLVGLVGCVVGLLRWGWRGMDACREGIIRGVRWLMRPWEHQGNDESVPRSHESQRIKGGAAKTLLGMRAQRQAV